VENFEEKEMGHKEPSAIKDWGNLICF
jgi:hypothetical protein